MMKAVADVGDCVELPFSDGRSDGNFLGGQCLVPTCLASYLIILTMNISCKYLSVFLFFPWFGAPKHMLPSPSLTGRRGNPWIF